ncbi:MAG: putative phospholipid-binding protein MlaC precursor [Pseudomonadota bacterium]
MRQASTVSPMKTSKFTFTRRQCLTAAVLALTAVQLPQSWAAQEAPDAFIARITTKTLNTLKADKTLRSGDIARIMQLVDSELMQYVNFRRMTALAVGPAWRKATESQRTQLQDAFKLLLVRTYAGALSQLGDQTVVVKPLRPGQQDSNLVVQTEVRGKGDPIQMDYRLEKTADAPSGWLVFDLNVLGVWLVENYRTQFSSVINANGIDALIANLNEQNKRNAGNVSAAAK